MALTPISTLALRPHDCPLIHPLSRRSICPLGGHGASRPTGGQGLGFIKTTWIVATARGVCQKSRATRQQPGNCSPKRRLVQPAGNQIGGCGPERGQPRPGLPPSGPALCPEGPKRESTAITPCATWSCLGSRLRNCADTALGGWHTDHGRLPLASGKTACKLTTDCGGSYAFASK